MTLQDQKQIKKSPTATSTITRTSTTTQDQETLPDIVHTNNRTDAATGTINTRGGSE